MQTLSINNSRTNIYINTNNNKSEAAEEVKLPKKRKKITIIKKIRRKDGSMEQIRQDIYKDYGSSYAR